MSTEEVGDLTFPESEDLMQTNVGESPVPDAQITIPMELMLSRFDNSKCVCVCVRVLLVFLRAYMYTGMLLLFHSIISYYFIT